MSEQMSLERKMLLLMFGARVFLTPAPNGMPDAIAKTKELVEKNPNFFVPSQFDNPRIHRETTTLEIWNDTDGQVDIAVCGVGTGGTATGITEVIKAKKPSFKMVLVEPLESPVISGGKLIVAIIPSGTERYLSTLLAAPEREEAMKLPTTPIDEKYLG
jgi:cysteine synthase